MLIRSYTQFLNKAIGVLNSQLYKEEDKKNCHSKQSRTKLFDGDYEV